MSSNSKSGRNSRNEEDSDLIWRAAARASLIAFTEYLGYANAPFHEEIHKIFQHPDVRELCQWHLANLVCNLVRCNDDLVEVEWNFIMKPPEGQEFFNLLFLKEQELT